MWQQRLENGPDGVEVKTERRKAAAPCCPSTDVRSTLHAAMSVSGLFPDPPPSILDIVKQKLLDITQRLPGPTPIHLLIDSPGSILLTSHVMQNVSRMTRGSSLLLQQDLRMVRSAHLLDIIDHWPTPQPLAKGQPLLSSVLPRAYPDHTLFLPLKPRRRYVFVELKMNTHDDLQERKKVTPDDLTCRLLIECVKGENRREELAYVFHLRPQVQFVGLGPH